MFSQLVLLSKYMDGHAFSWSLRVSRSLVSDSVTPRTVARQAPLSVGFSTQEHGSGWLCPSPRELPDPGVEPGSPASQADSLRFERGEARKRGAERRRARCPSLRTLTPRPQARTRLSAVHVVLRGGGQRTAGIETLSSTPGPEPPHSEGRFASPERNGECSSLGREPTLWEPVQCSTPGSSLIGILQAGILEATRLCLRQGSSQPRDRTQVSCIAGRFFASFQIKLL